MTKHRDLKLLIRKRMEKTGESYAAARRHIKSASSGANQGSPPTLEAISSRAHEDASPGSQQHGAPAAANNEIKGWRRTGDWPDYELRVDSTPGYRSPSSALIRSRNGRAVGSSIQLMQGFLAEHYRGCRLRLSAWMKSEGLTGACRLWMQLYDNRQLLVVAEAAPLIETVEWTRREVALDVDPRTTMILIGFTLDGAGAAWLADVEIEHGDKAIPADDTQLLPVQPRNLNFLE